MANPDYVHIEGRVGQVKVWKKDWQDYYKGDEVPKVDGKNTYTILLLCGEFINVMDGKIHSWTKQPINAPRYDKWGERLEIDGEVL